MRKSTTQTMAQTLLPPDLTPETGTESAPPLAPRPAPRDALDVFSETEAVLDLKAQQVGDETSAIAERARTRLAPDLVRAEQLSKAITDLRDKYQPVLLSLLTKLKNPDQGLYPQEGPLRDEAVRIIETELLRQFKSGPDQCQAAICKAAAITGRERDVNNEIETVRYWIERGQSGPQSIRDWIRRLQMVCEKLNLSGAPILPPDDTPACHVLAEAGAPGGSESARARTAFPV